MGGAEKSHDVMGYVRRNRVQCHGLLHVQVKDPSLQDKMEVTVLQPSVSLQH